MINFTLITALIICSISWISVSGSESQTVEVQSGQEVTLMCNKPKEETAAFWFRLINRTNTRCISVMTRGGFINYCTGFSNEKFEMSSNTSAVSLKIRQVDLSDSGLYFCGFYTRGGPTFSVIHLNIKGVESHDDVDRKSKKCDPTTKLVSVILGALTVLLVMIIFGLAVKNRKLQKAASKEQKPQQPEIQGSDELNYAAVNFCQKGRRREVEPSVVYSAVRSAQAQNDASLY